MRIISDFQILKVFELFRILKKNLNYHISNCILYRLDFITYCKTFSLFKDTKKMSSDDIFDLIKKIALCNKANLSSNYNKHLSLLWSVFKVKTDV